MARSPSPPSSGTEDRIPGLAREATRKAFDRAIGQGHRVLVTQGNELRYVGRDASGRIVSADAGSVPPTRKVTPGTSRRLK